MRAWKQLPADTNRQAMYADGVHNHEIALLLTGPAPVLLRLRGAMGWRRAYSAGFV